MNEIYSYDENQVCSAAKMLANNHELCNGYEKVKVAIYNALTEFSTSNSIVYISLLGFAIIRNVEIKEDLENDRTHVMFCVLIDPLVSKKFEVSNIVTKEIKR